MSSVQEDRYAGIEPSMPTWLSPLCVNDQERNNPSVAFASWLRLNYPTEREMDVILTRKLMRRSMPPQSPVTLVDMTAFLERFLRSAVSGDFEVSDQRWFAGGASKIQMGFTLSWRPMGKELERTRLVVRMEPAESLNSTSRAREFELLEAFAGVIPVPRTYWVDPEGEFFPRAGPDLRLCRGRDQAQKSEVRFIIGDRDSIRCRVARSIGTAVCAAPGQYSHAGCV